MIVQPPVETGTYALTALSATAPLVTMKNIELLLVSEVAEQFRVSKATVRRLARAGHLSAIRIGSQRALRIEAGSVQVFLERRRLRSERREGLGEEARRSIADPSCYARDAAT